jgi:hypothetical protein
MHFSTPHSRYMMARPPWISIADWHTATAVSAATSLAEAPRR